MCKGWSGHCRLSGLAFYRLSQFFLVLEGMSKNEWIFSFFIAFILVQKNICDYVEPL